MKRAIPFAAVLLTLALLIVAWNESQRVKPVVLIPTLTNQPEYCLTCHANVQEISKSHPTETFGCVSCHGGQALALEADLAHSTMRGGANPSDLSVVEASCGGSACHSGEAANARDHIQRVTTSVQATYTGAIATVRYAFGSQSDPFAHQGVYAIQDPVTATGLIALAAFDPAQETSPAVLSFASNCLNCHLAAEPLPGAQYARYTGCAACHTLTAGTDFEAHDPVVAPIHTLTTAIPYTQCNTCHNRGNYSMRDLQFHERTDAPTDRLHGYYQPIAQFTKCEYELDCVDCHTNGEAMGDGDLHNNQQEVQYTQCKTCHGTLTEPPLTQTITSPDDIALRLSFLNPVVALKVGDTIVVTEKGEPMWNLLQRSDGKFELISKVAGEHYAVPPVTGSACLQKPDQQESRYCHECHAVER